MGGRGRGGIGAIMGLVGGGREGGVGDVNREGWGCHQGRLFIPRLIDVLGIVVVNGTVNGTFFCL